MGPTGGDTYQVEGKTGQGPQREKGYCCGFGSHQVLLKGHAVIEVTGSLGLTPEILM